MDETVQFFCDERAADALDLLQTGGDCVHGATRLCTLIEDDRIEPCHLVGFGHHYGQSLLNVDQFDSVLRLLITKSSEADRTQRQCVVRFVSLFQRTYEHSPPGGSLFNSPARISLVVEVLDMSKGCVSSRVVSEWTDLAKAIVEAGCNDVFPMFRELLFSCDVTVTQKAIQTLVDLAGNYSAEVMDTFGGALLDKRGIYLRVHVCNDLVAAIDEEIIVSWLEREGDRAVELFARHLPHPFLDENGEFIVPKLLDRVLERFATDAVLSAFHAGLNSSEAYWGDLSPILQERAERYKTLLNHKNPAIRRFARQEVNYLSNWAKNEKQREEEDAIAN